MTARDDRRSTTIDWTLVLILLAALGGVVLWFIVWQWSQERDDPNRLITALGTAGLNLTAVAVVGGIIREAFARRESARRKLDEEYDFYRNLLSDIKSVYDAVETSRFLIDSHRSAKTYGEQVRGLSGAFITLHNINRALDTQFPKLERELAPHIGELKNFFDKLLKEYRTKYLGISDAQAVDEAINKLKREFIAGNHVSDDTMNRLGHTHEDYDASREAWTKIEALDRLSIILPERHAKTYRDEFLVHIDAASAILRRRLPATETVETRPAPGKDPEDKESKSPPARPRAS